MKVFLIATNILILILSSGCTKDDNSEADVYIVPADIPDEERILYAVHGGDIETVKEILGQYPDLLNAQDYMGNTLLHMASSSNRLHVVTYLLEQGADKTIQNFDGYNCYEVADEEGVSSKVLALLK
jgi:lysophospholipase